MQKAKINILSTRPLDNSLLEEAAKKSIAIEVLSFIETIPIDTIEVQQEIEQAILQSATVVFTSMNAIEAVAAQLEDQQPDWQIYTMGTTSQQLVKEYFGEDKLAGAASSAAELAELIAEESGTGEIIFFCGDQRRDELPDSLRSNNIEVHEIEVYHTIEVPHKIRKHYDGVLFFSPSAVRSFFSMNKADAQTILFAIGETTAKEIGKFTKNKVIMGEEPGKESLVREMIDFFSTPE